MNLRVLLPGFVGVAVLAAQIAAAHAEPSIKVLRAATASQQLEPGDVLFNFKRAKGESWWGRAIYEAQRAIQRVAGIVNKSLKLGDPSIVHTAIYVGDGRVAEAYGTNPDNAGVSINSLDEHPAEIYLVARPVDRGLAARAAAVAKKWAGKRRMGFLPPFHTPFRSSSFGPKARAMALVYGKGAAREGGPKGVSKMFCSELVIAVFQAAVVAEQLAGNPKLAAKDLAMPRALQLHASNASPLAQLGALRTKGRSGRLTFEERGKVQVDPSLPPRPDIYDWVRSKFKKIFR